MKFKNLKLVILDVDGTLTDGKIYYSDSGNEIKSFSVKDGMGISLAIQAGVRFAVITGRESVSVEKRCNELGIELVYQSIKNKKQLAKKIINDLNLSAENVMYIGDDINDLDVMNYVGISACPMDSASDVLEYVDIISKFKGGDGAVRDILETIFKEQGIWKDIISNDKLSIQ